VEGEGGSVVQEIEMATLTGVQKETGKKDPATEKWGNKLSKDVEEVLLGAKWSQLECRESGS